MIFVDTSVWIAAFRDGHGAEAVHLRNLLDEDAVALAGPVRIEILIGAALRERPRLRRLLSALPTYYPDESTWTLVDAWLDPASRAGNQFGFADLLIGALSVQQEGTIWSLDGDFRRMESCGLIHRHHPGG